MADGSIVIDTSIDNSGAESGLSKLGSIASKGFKAISASVAVAATAVAGLTKACIDQYAQFEQLKGGVETLFKDSSNKVMEYANNAFANAGLSANQYMDTVTSFSASLLQSLGGDTAKSADVANQAVTDMSDNVNKMGTSMESVQNAYQGFAKSNFTMLDNLRLGYGGTKEEMQRLLDDAEKLSGIHYDISNFADITEAIHVIQTEIGITGATADEAKTTIEGSLNMVKASWTNLITGMADEEANFDQLINNFVSSADIFGKNIMPRIEIALNGVSQLIEQLLPKIAERIPAILTDTLPTLVQAGANILTSLVSGIQQNISTIIPMVINIINIICDTILTMFPQLLQLGADIIVSLIQGIAQQLPTLIPAAIQCIMQLINTLIENLPLILDAGMQLLDGLIEGIVNAIPDLIAMLPTIIKTIINFLVESLPTILQQGCEILLSLINGLVEAIPDLIAMLPTIIDTIINFITNNLPQILQMGIKVLISLINGVVNAIPQLVAMLPQIINTIINTLTAHLPEIIMAGIQILVALAGGLIQAIPQLVGQIPTITKAIFKAFNDVNWLDIGINIIKGIGKGIGQMASWLWDKAKEVVSNVKDKVCDFLGIHSPSRLFRDVVGINIVKGIGVGFDKESPELNKLAVGNMEDLYDSLRGTVDVETAKTTAAITSSNYSYNNNKTTNNDNGITQNVTIVNPERTPSENARALKKAGRDLAFG
ncbi:MAG: phage tail protein [Clostridium sp.]|nr:phage tail protein [Clostridium sp.]